MEIDSTVAVKLREWLSAGRGWACWRNQEIASPQPMELFSPRLDAETRLPLGAPNWRYDKAFDDTCAPPMTVLTKGEPIAQWAGRHKRRYWGVDLSDATHAKAKRIADAHGAEYNWRWNDEGKPIVTVAKVTKAPFAV